MARKAVPEAREKESSKVFFATEQTKLYTKYMLIRHLFIPSCHQNSVKAVTFCTGFLA